MSSSIVGMLKQMKDSEECPPGLASKFCGVSGFTGTAVFGRLAQAAMAPFWQRASKDIPAVHLKPWALSHALRRSIEVHQAIYGDPGLVPRREVQLNADPRPAIVLASDAQVEPKSYPGGGYLLFDPITNARRGGWHIFSDEDLSMLRTSMADIASGRQPIARCECAMLPLVLMQEGESLRGRDVLWFVDNTAAMGSAIKGASGEAVLERLVGWFWMLSYRFQVRIWIEYVESDANWSDGISRLYDRDSFSREQGFRTNVVGFPSHWLLWDYLSMWRNSSVFGI